MIFVPCRFFSSLITAGLSLLSRLFANCSPNFFRLYSRRVTIDVGSKLVSSIFRFDTFFVFRLFVDLIDCYSHEIKCMTQNIHLKIEMPAFLKLNFGFFFYSKWRFSIAKFFYTLSEYLDAVVK